MRILLVTPYYYPELKFGGPPKRIHAFARELVVRGHEVTVATFHSEQAHRKTAERSNGILVEYLPWLGRFPYVMPRSFGALQSLVAAAEVVHLFGLYNLICPIAAWRATVSRKPFLLEPMGMFVPRIRSVVAKRVYNGTVTKWMARHASALVATSRVEAAELEQLGCQSKTVVRGNGIDVENFATRPSRNIMRKQWNIGENDRLTIYIGRISAKKCLRELVQAFVVANIPHSKLVIAGPVSEPGYFRKLSNDIKASGRQKDILMEGAVYGDDLKAAFSAADLFVLPSLNENFGNSAGEAVAARIPVLLTETCGIASIINGRAGLAIPLGTDSLTKGLQIMLDPVRSREFMADPEAVKRELSWEGPIAHTIALYQKIMREGAENRKIVRALAC